MEKITISIKKRLWFFVKAIFVAVMCYIYYDEFPRIIIASLALFSIMNSEFITCLTDQLEDK